jgi:hypothetical protein
MEKDWNNFIWSHEQDKNVFTLSSLSQHSARILTAIRQEKEIESDTNRKGSSQIILIYR